jgi:15-cis-phytoene synthase
MLQHEFATPADMALCRQMIRQGSKSFHLASLLLPNRYREQARSLYGFCRMADDLVDKSENARDAVLELSHRLDLIYAGTPGDAATDRAFADVVKRFAIPRAIPDALIEGFAWDATGKHYDTLSDVVGYGVRVAGTVGVMMSLIMGQRAPDALARAIDLGVAMQFSNIIRDVNEDAGLGRTYLPAQWLSQHDTSFGKVLLVAEAEELYVRAQAGIAMLPRSCRSSINAARLLYREIGLKAVRQGVEGRAIVGLSRKLVLVGKALRQTPFLTRNVVNPCLAEGQFLVDAVLQSPVPAPAYQGLSGRMGWVMDMFITVETRRS